MTQRTPIRLIELIERDILSHPAVRQWDNHRTLRPLYQAGEPAEFVYFVRSGVVKCERRFDDSSQPLLCIRQAGELIGEESLLGSPTYRSSAVMLTAGTVYAIPQAVFTEAANRNPLIWRELAELIDQFRTCQQHRFQMLQEKGVEERLLSILDYFTAVRREREARHHGQPEQDEIPLTQAELASLIGATRETTSTTLNLLERRGVLELHRRRIRYHRAKTQGAATETTVEAAPEVAAIAS